MLTMIKMLIIPFIYFSLLNIVNVYFSKKSFGFCLPQTFIVSTLLMFFSQYIFHTFYIAFYLLLAICLLSIVLLTKYFSKDDIFKKNVLSNGFYAFVVVYFIFYIIDFNRLFTSYDEFSHWGWFVRDMFENNHFYSDNIVDSFAHKEYPPFFPIFELQWNLIINEFSESITTLALHVFEFSILTCYISEKLEAKSLIKKLSNPFFLLACITPIVVIFDGHNVFNAIYVDYAVAIFYVYLMLLMVYDSDFIQKKNGIFWFSICLFGFALTKQIAVAFLLLIFLYYFLSFKKIDLMKILISPIIGLLLWKTKTSTINGQFDLEVNDVIQKIMNYNSFGKHYIWSLFTREITFGMIKVSFVCVSLLLIFIYIVRIKKYNDIIDKKLMFLIVVGTIGYSLLMYVMYVSSFSDIELANLASWERYFGSFAISEFIILETLFICDNKLTFFPIIIPLVSVLLFTNVYDSIVKVSPQCLIVRSKAHVYRKCSRELINFDQDVYVYTNWYGREEIEFYTKNKESIKYCNYEENVRRYNDAYVYVIDFSETVNEVYDKKIEINTIVFIE